jgi:hypothetical protein
LGPLDKSNSTWRVTNVGDSKTKLHVILSYDLRFGLFCKILLKLVMRRKLVQSLPDTLAAFKDRLAVVPSNASPAAVAVAA